MFTVNHANVFEAIYHSRGKDWAREAQDVAARIRARFPEADSLLDVACGTGIHLGKFSQLFSHCEGLDYAEPMLALAAERVPNVPLHHGDMRKFDLDREFDAITCMFCSIGYLDTLDDMRDAVRTMADHLVPGGVWPSSRGGSPSGSSTVTWRAT